MGVTRPGKRSHITNWKITTMFNGKIHDFYGHFQVPKLLVITSSTAQGGGGSFKNRKPIGKVGCCESGMAERIH